MKESHGGGKVHMYSNVHHFNSAEILPDSQSLVLLKTKISRGISRQLHEVANSFHSPGLKAIRLFKLLVNEALLSVRRTNLSHFMKDVSKLKKLNTTAYNTQCDG